MSDMADTGTAADIAYDEGLADGANDERVAVVKYLRVELSSDDDYFIDCIERGEHLRCDDE